MTDTEQEEKSSKTHRKNVEVRIQAGLAYMSEESAPSLEQLNKDPRFSSVSVRTLERWCKEDKWVERREAFFKAWAAKAAQKIGSAQMRQRLASLEVLDEVQNRALEKIRGNDILPKSWEGVAKIVIDTAKASEEIRVSAGEALMPPTSGGAPGGRQLAPSDINLTAEEARLAARTILQDRRARQPSMAAIAPLATPPAAPPTASTTESVFGVDEAVAIEARPHPEPVRASLIGDDDDDDEYEDLDAPYKDEPTDDEPELV